MRRLKKLIPLKVKSFIKLKFLYNISNYSHKKELKRLQKSNKIIKVAFLVYNESIWKADHLYRLLLNDARFEPVVFVCPYVKGENSLLEFELNQTYDNFKMKNYNVINCKKKDGTWYDIKKEFNPDIVFLSSPWSLSLPQYSISNYYNKLTCYIPYGFKISNLYRAHFNQATQNFVWKFFVETPIHKKLAEFHSERKGKNVVVSGYPGMDSLLENRAIESGVWKKQSTNKKKIIWAPHHTIPLVEDRLLDYSTFLDYYEFMFEIAEKYKDRIQIAFKPHPVLKERLYREYIWGKEKTDAYYQKWADLENGQLEEGDYIDLFQTSDALIHDSGSFIIEYLYTDKPVLFLINNEEMKEQFNEVGKLALSKMDLAYNKEEIENFVVHTIIENNDQSYEDRKVFYETMIKPPGNQLASQNIYEYLLKELKLEKNE